MTFQVREQRWIIFQEPWLALLKQWRVVAILRRKSAFYRDAGEAVRDLDQKKTFLNSRPSRTNAIYNFQRVMRVFFERLALSVFNFNVRVRHRCTTTKNKQTAKPENPPKAHTHARHSVNLFGFFFGPSLMVRDLFYVFMWSVCCRYCCVSVGLAPGSSIVFHRRPCLPLFFALRLLLIQLSLLPLSASSVAVRFVFVCFVFVLPIVLFPVQS